MADQSTSDEGTDGRGETAGTTGRGPSQTGSTVEWFTASILRASLAIFGFVLLLFALGQAVGVNLLGFVVEALSSRVGRWLVVALFALILILVALRGVGTPAE